MIRINITEFRKHQSYYINLSFTNDICLTKRGIAVAVLSNPNKTYYQTLSRLSGSLKDEDPNKNIKDLVGEIILQKYGY